LEEAVEKQKLVFNGITPVTGVVCAGAGDVVVFYIAV
jgi:hypothetical protein